MKINVTVTNKEAKKEESKYPYFGKIKDGRVLYVRSDGDQDGDVSAILIGETWYSNWQEAVVTRIIGTITIEQE